jgi:hypothetical protein
MPNFVENPSDVIAAARKNSVTAGETIRFPVSEDIPYVMLMNFKEYRYNENTGLGTSNYSIQSQKGSIILPLPLQLRDSVGIEASSVEGSKAAIFQTIRNGDLPQSGTDLQSNIRYYSDVIQKAAAAAALAASESKNPRIQALGGVAGLTALVAGVATGTTGSLFFGQAINPFETMEFKGVKLKTHGFNWRLSPSSSADSDALVKLINEIKKNMLPKYVGALGPAALAHALLQYPNVAMITFLGINQNYYYKLKPCMITGFDVRYNSGEQLNVFKGGKPVVVELALELTELQIHTSEDYGGDPITGSTTGQIASAFEQAIITGGQLLNGTINNININRDRQGS